MPNDMSAARAAREELASRPSVLFTCPACGPEGGEILVWVAAPDDADAWCSCGRKMKGTPTG